VHHTIFFAPESRLAPQAARIVGLSRSTKIKEHASRRWQREPEHRSPRHLTRHTYFVPMQFDDGLGNSQAHARALYGGTLDFAAVKLLEDHFLLESINAGPMIWHAGDKLAIPAFDGDVNDCFIRRILACVIQKLVSTSVTRATPIRTRGRSSGTSTIMLLFSVVSMLLLYLVERVHGFLPLNPQKSTMSYFTQMAGLDPEVVNRFPLAARDAADERDGKGNAHRRRCKIVVRSQAHGWAVWAAMAILFLAGVTTAYFAEARGHPLTASTRIASVAQER